MRTMNIQCLNDIRCRRRLNTGDKTTYHDGEKPKKRQLKLGKVLLTAETCQQLKNSSFVVYNSGE